MYNLQNYIEKIEILHIITDNWNYINVENSGNFLSEHEEKKSYRQVIPSKKAFPINSWRKWRQLT